MSPLIFLVVSLYLITSLSSRNGFKHLINSIWCITVVGISTLMKGYASPPPDLAIHRALVIIPPLIVGILFWLKQMKVNMSFFYFLIIFALFVFYLFSQKSSIAWMNIHQYKDNRVFIVERVQDSLYNKELDSTSEVNIFINIKDDSLLSLKDMLQYFVPSNTISFISDCHTTKFSKNSILFSDSKKCIEKISNKKSKYIKLYNDDLTYYKVVF